LVFFDEWGVALAKKNIWFWCRFGSQTGSSNFHQRDVGNCKNFDRSADL